MSRAWVDRVSRAWLTGWREGRAGRLRTSSTTWPRRSASRCPNAASNMTCEEARVDPVQATVNAKTHARLV